MRFRKIRIKIEILSIGELIVKHRLMKNIILYSKEWLKFSYELIRDTFKEYSRDKAFRHGAAIAYYTLFSLPAVLIIVIRLAGVAFGESMVREQVLNQIEMNLNHQTAVQVSQMMDSIAKDSNSFWATLLSVGTLIFGASGVFYSLRDSLNSVWKLRGEIRKGSFIKTVFDRLLSFTMVLTLGFILLVSMVLHTVIVALKSVMERFGEQVRDFLNSFSDEIGAFADQIELMFYIAYGIDAVIGLLIVTLTFAMIFKFLADAYPSWGDVLLGALFTAVLFNIGKVLIGWYISESNVGSTYGAAGSIVILLLWVYYSSQILLLGAEFIYVYTGKKGRQIKPSILARKLVDKPFYELKSIINQLVGKSVKKKQNKATSTYNMDHEADESSNHEKSTISDEFSGTQS